MRLFISSLAVSVLLVIGSCRGSNGARAVDAEPEAPGRTAGTINPSALAERIVEPHRMPSGGRPVHGTASFRPTPDGSTILSGTIVDDDGRPVAGARVWIAAGWVYRDLQASDYRSGPTFQTSVVETGPDGRYAFPSPRVRRRLASIVARKEGHTELILSEIELVPGHELDLGIRVLRRGAPFEVEFVDPEGQPVAGVGLAQVWLEGSNSWMAYAEWHGVSGSDGVVKTRCAPSLDAMARDSGWLSAVIPWQACTTLPISEWRLTPGVRHRHVLPPRRWIEGRLVGAIPGRRFAVSTGGRRAFGSGAWALRHYSDDHPIQHNRTPVTPTNGAFRVPTWSGKGDPSSRPQLVVHIERDDGAWQPIAWRDIDVQAVVGTTRHDAAFPPIDVQIPLLARLVLPAGKFPGVTTTVRIQCDAESGWLAFARIRNTVGELFLALEAVPEGTSELNLLVRADGFEEYESTVAIGDLGPLVDLGRVELKPRPPVGLQFVDDATGDPVEGVVWDLWDESTGDNFELYLDGGRSDVQGRIPLQMGLDNAYHEFVPPVGYELPAEFWDLIYTERDSADPMVIRLLRLDQQPVRIVDMSGQPRAGVLVRNGEYGVASVTDSDGRAVLHGRADDAGNWHVVVKPPALAGGWSDMDDAYFSDWNLPYHGVSAPGGALATIVAPRQAPYWIQASASGAAVEDLRFPETHDELYPTPVHPDHPGLLRIDSALPGTLFIHLGDWGTGVERELRYDHPGPDQVVHLDLSPAVIAGRIIDTRGAPAVDVTVRVAPLATEIRDADWVQRRRRASETTTTDAGSFLLQITDLDEPVRLTFQSPEYFTATLDVEALGARESRMLEQTIELKRAPGGMHGAVRLSLGQGATESRRVQIWPKGARVAGDQWAGVRTVGPDRPVLFGDLLEGDYEVEVLGMRHVLRMVPITVVAGETLEVVLKQD